MYLALHLQNGPGYSIATEWSRLNNAWKWPHLHSMTSMHSDSDEAKYASGLTNLIKLAQLPSLNFRSKPEMIKVNYWQNYCQYQMATTSSSVYIVLHTSIAFQASTTFLGNSCHYCSVHSHSLPSGHPTTMTINSRAILCMYCVVWFH